MYTSGTYITKPIGNNGFHYNERIALGSQGKIFVPHIIQGTVGDLEEGSEIVFEEAENGKLLSCKGLKHFVKTTYKGILTYIFDNHNHALFFRYQHTKQIEKKVAKPFTVIHIDQHADTKPNNAECKMQNAKGIESFVNEKTNVGNFITAALNNGIINEVIQIRSDYTLKQLGASGLKPGVNYILDIDMDFWEKKSEQEIESDFAIIRKLINNVCLITIATSPYFLDQKKAIELIKQLLKDGH